MSIGHRRAIVGRGREWVTVRHKKLSNNIAKELVDLLMSAKVMTSDIVCRHDFCPKKPISALPVISLIVLEM